MSNKKWGVKLTHCSYCLDRNLIHVDERHYAKQLAETFPDERLTLIPEINALLKSQETTHHVAHALGYIKDTYCLKCGYMKQKYQDDDRYIYICMECVE